MHGTALLLFDLDLSYNNPGNLSIKAHSRRSRLSGSGIAVFLKGNQNRRTASCGPELFLFCLSLSCSIRQKRLRASAKPLAVNLFLKFSELFTHLALKFERKNNLKST